MYWPLLVESAVGFMNRSGFCFAKTLFFTWCTKNIANTLVFVHTEIKKEKLIGFIQLASDKTKMAYTCSCQSRTNNTEY